MSGRYPRVSGTIRRRAGSCDRALYVMVHSYKYDNAPMPHSIFFYGQFAIHGTSAVGALGRPASHGCPHPRIAGQRDRARLWPGRLSPVLCADASRDDAA